MMQAITKEHDEFKAQHIFPIERRARSCMQYSNAYNQKILSEPDMRDAHIWFQHPTRTYLKFVEEYASNDFQKFKDQAEGDEAKYKYLRK